MQNNIEIFIEEWLRDRNVLLENLRDALGRNGIGLSGLGAKTRSLFASIALACGGVRAGGDVPAGGMAAPHQFFL